MKTKNIISIALAMLLLGCGNDTMDQNNTNITNSNTIDQSNTNSNPTPIIKPLEASANMSKEVVTIDGREVNLSDIAILATQPKQLTITPKLLYTLAYEASGGDEKIIVIEHEDTQEQINSTLADIEKIQV